MNPHALRALIALSSAAVMIAACDRPAAPRADAGTAGHKLDVALEKTQEKLAEATEKTKEQLAVAGRKTHEALAGAGAEAEKGSTSDTAITASIKASLLKDPDLSALKIEVDTTGGVVALNGTAPSPEAATRAGRIAEATKGVREVHNHVSAKKS